MARKPLGPMDINEYYQTMGARPEGETWEMPIYNNAGGKPITGEGRPAPHNSGNFTAPVYNYQGKPIISNDDSHRDQNGDLKYRVEVYRPGPILRQLFKAPKYNNESGTPIINNDYQGSGDGKVYRPSELKKTGVPIPMARKESLLSIGENRKVALNHSFSVYAPMPIGSFTRVSGLEKEWELESYREGGDNGGEHFFPRIIRSSHLVLEYGTGMLDPLARWFDMTTLGMMIKLPLMIMLTSELQIPLKIWMVMDAMPVKYTVPHFDALASEVAISRLEFTHNGFITII